MARAPELDEPSVVDHPVHDRGGKLVVREDRAPPAELHVRREHYAPPLVRIGYHLVEQAGAVHVERNVAELVQDEHLGPPDVGHQPVERSVALRLPELEHQRGRLEEAHGHPAPGRLDAKGRRHVRLSAAGGAVC